MLNMFRGGQVVWLNEEDAREIDVKDNDCGRSTTRMDLRGSCGGQRHHAPGHAIMYHFSERHITCPSPLARTG